MLESTIVKEHAFLSEIIHISTKDAHNYDTLTNIAQKTYDFFNLCKISIIEFNSKETKVASSYNWNFKKYLNMSEETTPPDVATLPILKSCINSGKTAFVSYSNSEYTECKKYLDNNDAKSYFAIPSPNLEDKNYCVIYFRQHESEWSENENYILKIITQIFINIISQIQATKLSPDNIDENDFINQIYDIATFSSDKSNTIKQICETVLTTLDIDRVMIYRFNHSKELTYPDFIHLNPSISPEDSNTLNLSKECFYKLFESDFLYCHDTSILDAQHKSSLEKIHVLSYCIFPIYVDCNIMGYVVFDQITKVKQWTDKIINILKNVVRITSHELQKSEVEYELKSTISELGFIAHLNNIINDYFDKNVALDKALEMICNFFDADSNVIYVENKSFDLYHIWLRDWGGILAGTDITEHPLRNEIILSIWDNDVFACNDTNTLDEKYHEYFNYIDKRAFIAFKINTFGGRKGFLVINKQNPHTWTQKEISIIKTATASIEALWGHIEATKEQIHLLKEQETTKNLLTSRQSLELIFNTLQDVICVVDPTTCEVIFYNDSLHDYLTMTECANDKPCHAYLFNNSSECDNCPVKMLYNQIDSDDEIETLTRQTYIEDLSRWLFIRYSLTRWIDSRTVVFITMTDITSQKQQELKIRHLAYHDSLLGIPNRLQFSEDMMNHLSKGAYGAIIFFDIDNFKNVNDTFGHSYGDLLLESVCEFLYSLDIPNQYFYRFGGDEFLIILDSATDYEAAMFCDKLLTRFRKPWEFGGESQYYTASIGVAFYPEDGSTIDELVKNSDIAMFNSKSSGKNAVSYFSRELDDSFSERVKIEDCLRYTVLNSLDEFELLYQPIMNIVTNKCIGAEALLRWNSKELGLLTPNQFLPIAESLGLIVPLGAWVFETACKQLKEWQTTLSRDFKLNINVSNRQLQKNNFVDIVRESIENNGVSPRLIVVEVAECNDMNEVGAIHDELLELKDIGVSIAMDDFGTGYSSLSNIMDGAIDIIKIDRSFINNIATDKLQLTFVKSITNLSQVMRKKIFIEGVETKEQLDVLIDMGNVSIVQGYYYTKPLTVEAFEDWYVRYLEENEG